MPTKNYKNKYFFILNGMDLEMAEIVKILKHYGIQWIMPYQDRGTKLIKTKDLPAYRNTQLIRVYIECWPEKKLSQINDILIDHHNTQINQRASLIQVKKLLCLSISQKDLWVEGYDRAGVKGALIAGTPKTTLRNWINNNLKKFDSQQTFAYWSKYIQNSPEINGLKIVKLYQKNKNLIPSTAILQTFDFINYPQTKNLLLIVYQNKKTIKYLFTADAKISYKLKRKFNGYIFGNPQLKNVCWGIQASTWPIPTPEKVLKTINNKLKTNATHKK